MESEPANVINRNPYELVLANKADCNGQDFYTITRSGVTEFSRRNGTETTSLLDWLKFRNMFNLINKDPFRFPLMKGFKIYKAFAAWKCAARRPATRSRALPSRSASSKSTAEITAADIPWPAAGDADPLPGALALPLGDRKVRLRLLQRRWHPDKFTQRFGARLGGQGGERDAALQRVTAISQAINAVAAACL